MNESFIDDAVVFHDRLNPSIWDNNGDMKPEVRSALLAMADEFIDFLGVDNLNILDITVSGSNAAYSYTMHSDIDLHVVVRIPEEMDKLYLELFDAKKNLYNLTHNQTIKGFDVEFYVQDASQPVESMGIYSVMRGTWDKVPVQREPSIDDLSVKSKVYAYTELIREAIRRNDEHYAKRIWDNLKSMRKAGLDKAGEFSAENLAYKVLRARGLVNELYDFMLELKDQQLSLESRDNVSQ